MQVICDFWKETTVEVKREIFQMLLKKIQLENDSCKSLENDNN